MLSLLLSMQPENFPGIWKLSSQFENSPARCKLSRWSGNFPGSIDPSKLRGICSSAMGFETVKVDQRLHAALLHPILQKPQIFLLLKSLCLERGAFPT